MSAFGRIRNGETIAGAWCTSPEGQAELAAIREKQSEVPTPAVSPKITQAKAELQHFAARTGVIIDASGK